MYKIAAIDRKEKEALEIHEINFDIIISLI